MPDIAAPNSRYNRGLKHLQAAHEAVQAFQASESDCGPELAAMQAIAAALYSRALEGDTEAWRAALLAACTEDTPAELRALIKAGVAEDELYQTAFDTLDRLAGRRNELMGLLLKRQHTITQAQVVELLALWLSDLRSELDAQTYGRLVPRLLRRTPEIGMEEKLG